MKMPRGKIFARPPLVEGRRMRYLKRACKTTQNAKPDMRRGAGVVERGGLENRCALAGTVGSNPTLSAIAPSLLRCSCRRM